MKIGEIIIGSKKFSLEGRYSKSEGIIIEVKGLKFGNVKTLAECGIEHISIDPKLMDEFLQTVAIEMARVLEHAKSELQKRIQI